MSEQEVLELWKSGISKHKIANIYKQRFNQQVKVIRAEVVNKYKARYISNYEALKYVELIIYRYIMYEEKRKRK